MSSSVTGNVSFVGRGCPADSIAPGSPEDPYLDDPAGKVALIDRGSCAISLKIERAAKAGAIGGADRPGRGRRRNHLRRSAVAGRRSSRSLVITQATANLIKANIAAPVNVTISPAFAIPLVGSVVSSSSRGPSTAENAIKPDIAAPGASVSAVAGTGTAGGVQRHVGRNPDGLGIGGAPDPGVSESSACRDQGDPDEHGRYATCSPIRRRCPAFSRQ